MFGRKDDDWKKYFLEQLIIKRYFCGNKGNRIINITLKRNKIGMYLP